MADRVDLPELPRRLYHGLVKVAARYAVPLDQLAEYILRPDEPTVRDLAAEKRAEREELKRQVWCRIKGPFGLQKCPAPFSWRGEARCGCSPAFQ